MFMNKYDFHAIYLISPASDSSDSLERICRHDPLYKETKFKLEFIAGQTNHPARWHRYAELCFGRTDAENTAEINMLFDRAVLTVHTKAGDRIEVLQFSVSSVDKENSSFTVRDWAKVILTLLEQYRDHVDAGGGYILRL